MQITSFNNDLTFGEKATAKVILETSFSKEIRILLKKGQTMKEHKAPSPIVLQVLKGEINFRVYGSIQNMKEGGILSLGGNILHELYAKEDSVVRLTLLKLNQTER